MNTITKNPKLIVTKTEIHLKDPPKIWKKADCKDYQKAPRLYFWFEGETVLDHLVNRRSEPYTLIRKLLPDLFKSIGLDLVKKPQWSQYAGCSCPCSPGFILKDASFNVNGECFSKFDIFITIGVVNEDSCS